MMYERRSFNDQMVKLFGVYPEQAPLTGLALKIRL